MGVNSSKYIAKLAAVPLVSISAIATEFLAAISFLDAISKIYMQLNHSHNFIFSHICVFPMSNIIPMFFIFQENSHAFKALKTQHISMHVLKSKSFR